MSLVCFWAPLNGDKPGPWKLIEATPEAVDKVRREGAAFISTMAFEHEPEEGKNEPCRCGPFVLDLDHKEDPEIARLECIDIVNYLILKGAQPQDLRLYVSGRNGFHIIVPPYLIGAIKGDPLLPKIHKKMAQYIAARVRLGEPSTIDMSMYSMGKGKLLRLENVRREIGTYKVPITWEELSNMYYSELIKLAEAPRKIHESPPSLKAAKLLAEMFAFHQQMVHSPPNNGLVDPAKFIMKCKFVRHCVQNAASLSEPEWHALLSVLKGLGKRGLWLAHDLSCTYPDYDSKQTNEKFDRVVPNIGCDKLKELFDCGRDCRVPTPSKLWATSSAVEAIGAAKSSEAQKLIKFTEGFILYPSEDGEAYADVIIDGHRATFQVNSLSFQQYLGFQYYQEFNKPLKHHAVKDLVNDLMARAVFGKAENGKSIHEWPITEVPYRSTCVMTHGEP